MHQVNIVRALNPLALFNQGAESGRHDRVANPSRRGRRSVEKNPSPGTWLLIMGASAFAVGGGIALALRGNNHGGDGGGTVPGDGGGGTVPGDGGGGTRPGDRGTGAYVGDPRGYDWPMRNVFPTQGDFGAVLEQAGYNVGDWESPNYSVISNPTLSSIKQFQRDWNVYRAAIAKPWASQLGADGRLGTNTIKALAGVYDAMNLGLDWAGTIADLRGQVS